MICATRWNKGCGSASTMSLAGVTGDSRIAARPGPAASTTACTTSRRKRVRFSIEPP